MEVFARTRREIGLHPDVESLSISVRVLVVCHCYRQRGDVIRIISARKADRDEIDQYQPDYLRSVGPKAPL